MNRSILRTLWRAFAAQFISLGVLAVHAQAQETSREDFFESRVRPLLISKCSECHGPETQWGELRVDSRTALLKGGEHGPAIVPDNPQASLIIAAVERTGDLKMPPDDRSPLTIEEVQILKQWIQDGAYWTAMDSAQLAEIEKQKKWQNH